MASTHTVDSRPVRPPPRAPSAWVLREHSPIAADAPVDWSKWHLTWEEDIGQSPEQDWILELLRSCIKELARERGWKNVLVGCDAFFGWVKEHPQVQVSPDLYLLDNPPRVDHARRSWQTWKPGVNPPRFAVEIVSVNWKKDLEDAPERYAQLGCRELVIFDPTKSGDAQRKRPALTVYRRQEDGAFSLVEQGEGPVWSNELNASLVSQNVGGANRLRVARDAEGKDLVPSTEEARADDERKLAELQTEIARLKARKI